MEAEQHLSARASVEEDERRMTLAVAGRGGQEELAVNLETVGCREDDLLGRDELRAGVRRRDELRGEVLQGAVGFEQRRT